MEVETSKERLGRVTTGLLKVISFCDLEIRECKTQILVREESLGINVVDNRPTLEQLDKYRETLTSLMDKIETVSERVALSKAEIKRLTKVIKDLSAASANVDEVRSLVEHYQASIRHHSDIIRVGGLELDVEEKRAEEIRSTMTRMQDELVRAEEALKNSREASYKREIQLLSGTVGKLNENRDAINNAVEKINAIGLKKRKIVNTNSFSQATPDRRITKRARSDLFSYPAEGNQVDAASLLAPFLPPTAAKLLCFSGDKYDAIEWNTNLNLVPLYADAKSSLFNWSISKYSAAKSFALQSYSGLTGYSYRVVAINPFSMDQEGQPEDDNVSVSVIPLAHTKEQEQADNFFALFEQLETSSNFDYPAVWRVLCKFDH